MKQTIQNREIKKKTESIKRKTVKGPIHWFLEHMIIEDDEDYYYDEEDKDEKDQKDSSKRKSFEFIITIVVEIVVIIMLIRSVYIVGLSKGLSESDKAYQEGYEEGAGLGYEAAYPEIYDSGYWAGFIEGGNKASSEGYERKIIVTSAYNDLLMCEYIPQKELRNFTRRITELMKQPVPELEDVDQFVEDVEEILSYFNP